MCCACVENATPDRVNISAQDIDIENEIQPSSDRYS